MAPTRFNRSVPSTTQGTIGTPARIAMTHAPRFIVPPRKIAFGPVITPPSGKMPTISPARASPIARRIVRVGTPSRSNRQRADEPQRRARESIAEELDACDPVDRPPSRGTK